MRIVGRVTVLTVLSFFYISSALAQFLPFRSGDIQIDADLGRINVSAQADFGGFKTEMASMYGVPQIRIEELHTSLQMSPADIYFFLEIGRVTRRPSAEIITVYQAQRKNGWGAIAKELGIKPGSSAFHALKSKTTSQGKYYEKKDNKAKAAQGKSQGKTQGKSQGKSGK